MASPGQLHIRGNLTAQRLRNTYTNLANGTALSPTLAFANQENTGVYLATDGFAVATLGVEALRIRSNDGQLIADDAWGLANINAANVTGLFSAANVSGNIVAANISGNGAGLTSINLANTYGTLAVLKGGTGVTSATGTGSVVLNNAPVMTGTVTATTFVGSGAGLSALNAANLTGTIPDARISGAYSGITTLTATTFSGSHVGSGAGLSALNAANLSTGTIPDARISGAYSGITTLSATTFNGSGAGLSALNSANLTGTLAILKGGTGTTTATGTGSVVLNGAPTFTGTTIMSALNISGLTASTALATDASKNVVSVAGVSATEIGYLSSVTSNIQAQLNAKYASGASPSFQTISKTSGGTFTLSTSASPILGVTNAFQLLNTYNNTGFNVYYDGTYGSFSDFRLKDDISTLHVNESMDFIKALRPVQYTIKNTTQPQTGFIAQEVIQSAANDAQRGIVPNYQGYDVNDAETPMLTISEHKIIAPLLQVVQQLITRIETLENLS